MIEDAKAVLEEGRPARADDSFRWLNLSDVRFRRALQSRFTKDGEFLGISQQKPARVGSVGMETTGNVTGNDRLEFIKRIMEDGG